MQEALAQALEALKGKAGERVIDAAIKFSFTDIGALRIDQQGVRLDDGSEADCTISADIDTFKAMFDGELSPTAAFMTGRIKIAGDMGVAMKMASLLG